MFVLGLSLAQASRGQHGHGHDEGGRDLRDVGPMWMI